MVIYNCDLCGKEVRKTKVYHRSKRRYCSHECRSEGQKTTFIGSNNPNYRGRDKEKWCPNCGNEKDIRANICSGCFSHNVDVKVLKEVVKNTLSFFDAYKEYVKIKNVKVSSYKIEDAIQKNNIDYSHFNMFKKIDGYLYTSKDLVKNSKCSRGLVRGILIREKILDHTICVICKVRNSWCDKSLTLQVDHIDGDHTNNEISNLRFLCPNCHSQTSTFCGRKRKHVKSLVQ